MIEASEEEIFQAAQRTHTPYDHVYLRKNTKLEELVRVSGALLSAPDDHDAGAR